MSTRSCLTLADGDAADHAGACAGSDSQARRAMRRCPNVPTYGEMGFPNVYSGSWVGFFAPAKTPDAVVAKLNAEINRDPQGAGGAAAAQDHRLRSDLQDPRRGRGLLQERRRKLGQDGPRDRRYGRLTRADDKKLLSRLPLFTAIVRTDSKPRAATSARGQCDGEVSNEDAAERGRVSSRLGSFHAKRCRALERVAARYAVSLTPAMADADRSRRSA